jgi:integrase
MDVTVYPSIQPPYIERGGNGKKISETLGHSNVVITLSTYSHVTKQMDHEAIDRMDQMLSQAGF